MSRARAAAQVTDQPSSGTGGVLAWTALVVVYLVWGSTFLAIRVAVRNLPPATFAGARYLLAGLLLYPVAMRMGSTTVRDTDHPGVQEWAGCAAVGILLLTVGNGGVTLAEQHLDSGFAALLAATIPLWMIVYTAAWIRRVPSGREALGVAVGLVGVAVLTGSSGAGGHAGSLVVALVAASGWGLGSVLARHVPLPQRTLLGAAMQLMIGGVVLLAAGALRGEWAHLHLAAAPVSAWFAFAWLVVPGSILAFSAYGYALSHLPLGIVSTYAYVNPVVAVLLGVAILGERLSWNETVGAGLIVLSVAVTLLRRSTPGERSTTGRRRRCRAS